MDPNLLFAGAILFLSIILQVWAAGIAFSLVELSDRMRAWLLVALAILLMALRRAISMVALFTGAEELQANIPAELVALATSALLVLGLSRIRPLFASIQHSRDQLERHTEQLDATNEELRAFSYTVSHDLKKPVRHIDGYIQLIEEKCANEMDDESRSYLAKVRENSREMNELITNMLKLAQATEGNISRDTVNLSTMATGILEELRQEDPDRKVNFDIEAGVFAECDPHLMRSVMENIFGNAWKFTAPREETQISFHTERQNGATVYVVSDNGVGFQSDRARELFLPFRRFNPDFAGSGIGLATTARIIRRHGGRIWAESKPGEGATFYFTLA